MTQNELFHLLALMKVPGIGAVTAKQLISYCGSPSEVFQSTTKQLLQIPGIGNTVVETLKAAQPFDDAEKELDFCLKNDIQLLPYTHKEFPSRLKQYNDAPVLLFYKGSHPLNSQKVLAIVGTRTPSPHGKSICETIVQELVGYGITIVSGLAYGVDAIAHRKSLEFGLPTIGVLGHGLRKIYPAEHHQLAQQMIEKNGGILTEFHSDTQPDRENFPMRNRIVAGMSDAVLVIESARKGGSLITAEFANAYNKDVFAIPGRVHDKFSEGCNDLIKQNKANLVESAQDIIQHMIWEEKEAKPIQTSLLMELNDKEQLVVDFLRTTEDVHIDKISHTLKLSPSATAALLLELEFKGLVRSLPGKVFALQ